MPFSGCWFFRKRKLSAVSHNPVMPAIVNIDCHIRAVSSLARLAELILSDFFIFTWRLDSCSCVCLSPFPSSFYKNEEDDAPIKRCPKCKVYIERDEGCAQMMCKNCKHAFCWYCLESLDVSRVLIIICLFHDIQDHRHDIINVYYYIHIPDGYLLSCCVDI